MQKLLLSILCFVFLCVTPAFASGGCCGERFVQGLKNFASAPLELPKKVAYYSNYTDYHPYGIAAAFGEGSMAMARKLVAGIIQMATFPFDASDIDYDLY